MLGPRAHNILVLYSGFLPQAKGFRIQKDLNHMPGPLLELSKYQGSSGLLFYFFYRARGKLWSFLNQWEIHPLVNRTRISLLIYRSTHCLDRLETIK